MFPRKYAPHFMSFFMAVIMSCIMSFVITTFNVGLVPDLLSIWLRAWGFAFLVALPTIFVVAPVVRKLAFMMVVAEK